MWALLRFEATKMLGRRITWVPFLVLALVVTLITAVFHRIEFKTHQRLFMIESLIFASKAAFVNGYFMTAHAMNPVFQLLMPVFIAVASGLAVAGEAEQGTLRACLIRPISRQGLLLAKFIVLGAYAMVLSYFFLAFVVLAGVVNFGTGNLYTLNAFFNNGTQFASAVPEVEVPARIVLAGLLASAGMAVLAALALLVSALVETAAMAYVITLSIYLAELTLRSLPFLDWLYPYLFVTHMLRWQQCFHDTVRTDEILVSLGHLAGYLAAFLCAAMLLFSRKDVKT